MSLIDEKSMIESGYTKLVDHLRIDATVYSKNVMDDGHLSYIIEIYEYDFGKFRHRGYNGPEYRHEVELSFQQENGPWLKIIFPIDHSNTIAWVEERCEKAFIVNEGISVKYEKEEE